MSLLIHQAALHEPENVLSDEGSTFSASLTSYASIHLCTYVTLEHKTSHKGEFNEIEIYT